MATSLLSFTLIPVYTVPNPPFPKTSRTLYASSKTVFLLFFKYLFTEQHVQQQQQGCQQVPQLRWG